LVLWLEWKRHAVLMPYVAGTLFAVIAFFLGLAVFLAHPFQKFPVQPTDGVGLNPILEHPLMAIHPPLLLTSYMAFGIPFAIALGGLVTRTFTAEWVATLRRWLLIAWLISLAGNTLGAAWAYDELDLAWGGYWGWDPVENAAIMPWFTATAGLHALAVFRLRGLFRAWSIFLVLFTFFLALFGTFLGRSSFLQSVHSFGASALSPYLGSLVGVALLGSLSLLFLRRRDLQVPVPMSARPAETSNPSTARSYTWFSKEGAFILSTLLLFSVGFIIFWAALYPLFYELATDSKLAVQPSFYNRVLGGPLLAIVLLLGFGPFMAWRRADGKKLLDEVSIPLIGAALAGIGLVVAGVRDALPLIAVFLLTLVILMALQEWVTGTLKRRRSLREGYPRAFVRLLASNRSRYGGYMVHVALMVVVIGAVGSSFFKHTVEVTLRPGESADVAGYTLRYDYPTQDYLADRDVYAIYTQLYRGEKLVSALVPAGVLQRNFGQIVIEPAIYTTPLRDVKVVVTQIYSSGAADFEVHVNPLVMWIWIGAGLMAVGGLFAFWPARHRSGG
ncbi:MAG: cytochrome c biogenesis protein CcsA, partial [Chloroflexi bacterium]|nr:cytochrome c biogenesis protein CcsA [Chloroflexota bacterium]